MDSSDDDVLEQRITEAFSRGIIYTRDDFLQLIHHYSLDELALIVVTYGNEALAALRDHDRANKRVLKFVGAIHDHLSDEDRVTFTAHLKDATEGFGAQDERLLRRLPIAEYELNGGELGIRLVFPDDDES